MTRAVAHKDFETRSTLPLGRGAKNVGLYRYAEDPTTGVWGFSYSLPGDPRIRRWEDGDPPPQDYLEHVRSGGIVVAHNAAFERIIWNKVIRRDHPDWPELRIEQMSCTMVRALAMNLPADLDRLGEVLSLPVKKDMEGHALMMKMAKPRKNKKGETGINWIDDDISKRRLAEYRDDDVRTETEADLALPELTPSELELWHIDQRMNDRGVAVDVEFAQRAAALVEYAKIRADQKMQQLTNGAVGSVGQVGEIVKWLNERGIATDTLRKGDQDDLITLAQIYDDALAEEVIELRRAGSKTSTAKYSKIMQCLCADGRLRGLFQFNGASQTLRWAGRLTQPQNYPRVDAETEATQVAFTVRIVKDRSLTLDHVYEMLELVGAPNNALGEPQKGMATLMWLSKALRSTIVAAPGHRLVGGDFANIEGRINAWLSGEQWKIEAFRAYDQGTGPDLYKVSFSRSFGVPVEEVNKQQRQIGKVEELALGYEGGVGAFTDMTQTYMVKLHRIASAVQEAVTAQTWDTMAARYAKAMDKRGLPENQWTAVKIVVTNWREAHPNTVWNWRDLADAAIRAVDQPNTIVPVYYGRVRYMSDGYYLYCQLPNNDVICYPQPYVKRDEEEFVFCAKNEYQKADWYPVDEFFPDEIEAMRFAGYEFRKRTRHSVRFYALDDRNQWRPHALYGGYQCENIVQSTARAALKTATFNVERAGYPLVLTVHDELAAEVPYGVGSAEHFKQLMMQTDPWLDGCPISAETWEDERYVK